MLDTALAWSVGAVLIAAAISKSAEPAPLSASLRWLAQDMGLAAGAWGVFIMISALVAVELALGALLLSGWRRRAIAVAAMVLLLAFTAALARMALDPAAPSCGCFGAAQFAEKAQAANQLGVVRNIAMIVACGAIMVPSRGP